MIRSAARQIMAFNPLEKAIAKSATAVSSSSNLQVFLLCLVWRVLSVFVVRTWYVPDEHWQSTEVAHRLAFGYGYLTWEWQKGIRGYMHPTLIALAYQALAAVGLDTVQLLVLVPRLMQATLSAYADYRLYRWSNNSKWTLLVCLFSCYWYYTATRTLLNTFEASITAIGLSVFPFKEGSRRSGFIWLVAALAFVRPTALVPWLPLCVHHALTSSIRWYSLLLRYLLIGVVVGSVFIGLDIYQHGSIIITTMKFFEVNIVDNIGVHYGSQPWYYYIVVSLFAHQGLNLVFFVPCVHQTATNRDAFPVRYTLLKSIVFTVLVYSLMPHKENRFLLGISPMMIYMSGDFIARWSRKTSGAQIMWAVKGMLVSNICAAIAIGWFYQAGPVQLMMHVQQIARDYRGGADGEMRAKILFLLPCHSTPFYSHVHENVTMKILTCDPPPQGNVGGYVDIADQFYKAPSAWLRSHLPRHPPSAKPTHVVIYDELAAKVSAFLADYRLLTSVPNTPDWLPAFIQHDQRSSSQLQLYELVVEDGKWV